MKSKTITISGQLKVKILTGMVVSDLERYIRHDDQMGDVYDTRLKRDGITFNHICNSAVSTVDSLISDIKTRRNELGSGAIAIADYAPFVTWGKIYTTSGIGIFCSDGVESAVIFDILRKALKYRT